MNAPGTVLNRLVGAERLRVGARDLPEAGLIGRLARRGSDLHAV